MYEFYFLLSDGPFKLWKREGSGSTLISFSNLEDTDQKTCITPDPNGTDIFIGDVSTFGDIDLFIYGRMMKIFPQTREECNSMPTLVMTMAETQGQMGVGKCSPFCHGIIACTYINVTVTSIVDEYRYQCSCPSNNCNHIAVAVAQNDFRFCYVEVLI